VAKSKGLNALVLGDASRLPFSSSSVDVVLFVTALEFVKDVKSAVSEAVRVAKKGVVVGFLNAASLLHLSRVVKSWFLPTVYREVLRRLGDENTNWQ
jgi:ubiquinone/menaquinone biosynthesis C-methylase UbiE